MAVFVESTLCSNGPLSDCPSNYSDSIQLLTLQSWNEVLQSLAVIVHSRPDFAFWVLCNSLHHQWPLYRNTSSVIFMAHPDHGRQKWGGWGGLGRPTFSVSFWNLNFDSWIILMVLFLLGIHFSLTGQAERVWQTQQSLDQCFDWDDVANPSLAGEKHAYRQHRFVPPRTLRSKRKRELRRPENNQIESAVATHSWRELLGIRSRITKYWLAFVHCFFARFADGHQSSCVWSWSEFCYHAKICKWCF